MAAKKEKVLSSDGDREVRLRGYREVEFIRCKACDEFVEEHSVVSMVEGATCIVGARGGSRFDGEWWVFVEEVPERIVMGSAVCDACVVALVERGALRRV